jgi:hypothetical protein
MKDLTSHYLFIKSLTFDFSSSSNPRENSCCASGIFGIGVPSGIPAKSRWSNSKSLS